MLNLNRKRSASWHMAIKVHSQRILCYKITPLNEMNANLDNFHEHEVSAVIELHLSRELFISKVLQKIISIIVINVSILIPVFIIFIVTKQVQK